MIYVQQSWLHGFIAVNLETGEPKTIGLPELPEGTETPAVFPHTWSHGLALTPDEKFLFANGSIADYVAVYSHPELDLIKTIPVGDDPNWIDFDEAGRFAYISNRGSDDLSVIDAGKLEEAERIRLGFFPQRLEVARVPKRNP